MSFIGSCCDSDPRQLERKRGSPVLAGEDDRLIDINEQSVRLHDEVKQSKLHRIAGAGHMIQQSATPDLMAAIDEVAAETLH
jgi:pimeloyl-ACP methyl ester carboxylesterase